MSWLLSVLESGYTLPPLDALLESSIPQRGGLVTTLLVRGDKRDSISTTDSDIEAFRRWTADLERVASSKPPPSSSKSRRQQQRRGGSGVATASPSYASTSPLMLDDELVSPYIAHRGMKAPVAPPLDAAPESRTSSSKSGPKQIGTKKANSEEVLKMYKDFQRQLASSSSSSMQSMSSAEGGAAGIRKCLSVAVAAHISQEAAMRSKKSNMFPDANSKQQETFSTLMTIKKGSTFDEHAREKAKNDLTAKIFSGKARSPFKAALGSQDQRRPIPNPNSTSLLEFQHPPPKLDPLYRIMREEAELTCDAQSRLDSGSDMAPILLDDSQVRAKTAAAVYDKEARRALRQQVVLSTRMITGQQLAELRSFGTLSSDMWITLRAVYFIFISYYETMVAEGRGAGAAEHESVFSSVVDNKIIKIHNPAAASIESSFVQSDVDLFASMSQTVNMSNFWGVIRSQCSEFDISTASVMERFTWPLFQALLDFPRECSCALVYIERGEDVFDEKVGEMLEGKLTAANFWKSSRFYRLFPENNLSFLRAAVAPSMFNPMMTASKSVPCARLCSWARRVIAGLFASKTLMMRNISRTAQYDEKPNVYDLAFNPNGSVANYQGDDWSFRVGESSLSVTESTLGFVGGAGGGSVFNRSTLSAQSPTRRIEQFINYPGTAASGSGIMLKGLNSQGGEEDVDEFPIPHQPLTIVAAVPHSLVQAADSASILVPDALHSAIFRAAIILGRPTDRIDFLIMPEPTSTNQQSLYPEERLSTQMMSIFTRHFYEDQIVALSSSPMHRVVTLPVTMEELDESHQQETAAFVSFNDVKGWSSKRVSGRGDMMDYYQRQQREEEDIPAARAETTDALIYASSRSVDADLIVVSSSGLGGSADERTEIMRGNRVCSVAMVVGRHWAFDSALASISRFVVFVDKTPASRAAFSVRNSATTSRPSYCLLTHSSFSLFQLTLRLAKSCDLIFLIHAVTTLESNDHITSVLSEYRKFGYNVHMIPLDSDNGEDDFYENTASKMHEQHLALRLISTAKDYEPTHIIMGASASDIACAMAGAAASNNLSSASTSLAKQMALVAASTGLLCGAHTLILAAERKILYAF